MNVDKRNWYAGGCHCKTVRFEVELPEEVEAQTCNCSMCSMTAFLHVIVPESRFRLLQGEGNLSTYTFNTGVAKHLFCKTCGIKSFYRPRSNPDGWSVNAPCIDDVATLNLKISDFDGRDWESHAKDLAHLSKEK
jgi:hypothetical protein